MTTTIASQSYTRLRFSLNNFYGSARVSHEQIFLIEQNLKSCNRPLPNTEQDQQLSLRGQVSISGAFYTGKGKLNFVLLTSTTHCSILGQFKSVLPALCNVIH